jgi:hypothetical protein
MPFEFSHGLMLNDRQTRTLICPDRRKCEGNLASGVAISKAFNPVAQVLNFARKWSMDHGAQLADEI